jgi:hypothetical protein
MTWRSGSAGLLAALILTWPLFAADKKNTPPPKDTAGANDYQALADAHSAIGKLVSVGGTDKTLGLRIDYQMLQPNPNAGKSNNNSVQHLLQKQQQVLRTRNPFQRAVRMQQLEVQLLKEQTQAVNNAFKVVRDHKEFDLATTPEVAVRYLEPPVLYDDKGNLKKYTAAELKEMKGKNPDLPGYTAEFDKLQAGQTVRVTLAKPKANKEKDKEAAADDTKPQVSMVVVIAEAPLTDTPAPKGKKNK